jgi:hypothetical protein
MRQAEYDHLKKTYSASQEDQYLYLIQLVPELSPLRIKVGLSSNLASRMQTIQVVCPQAKLVRAWRADYPLEQEILAKLHMLRGCVARGREVFDVVSVSEVEECITQHIAQLGRPLARHKLRRMVREDPEKIIAAAKANIAYARAEIKLRKHSA